MKILAFGAALSAAALAIPTVASAQQLPAAVVAVVDRSRIAQSCTACTAALQQLQAQEQQLQQRAQQLGQPLQTEAQALETAVRGLQQGQQPDAALQQRIQTFQTQQQTAETEIATRQQTLRRNAAFVQQQILERIDAVVPQIMQQRGANLAIDRATTVAMAPQLDITDAVLAAVNQNAAAINVNAPAPQQQPAQQQRPQGR